MFFLVFANIWIRTKICGDLKIKFTHLKMGEMFLQVFGFFQAPQYWCDEFNIYFLVYGFVSQN